MIAYPIAIDEFEISGYDPFLRHRLGRKKKRRRSGRVFRKHPKRRVFRSVGRGRIRRSARIVRRPIRIVNKRYRSSMGSPRRNTMVSRPRTIKKPLGKPPIQIENRIHRNVQRNRRISRIGIQKPRFKGTPILSGDPRKRTKPPVSIPNKRIKPKVSGDIIIPYKRRYGSRKRRALPMPKRVPKQSIIPMEEELPIVEEDMNALNTEVVDSNEKENKPEKRSYKRKMQNIIGVTVLGLLVTGLVVYKMKTKIEANGRTS